MRPKVVVPSGRGDAGPVATAEHEPVVGPWDPGAFDLDFGKSFQLFIIFLYFGHVLQGRNVPGATNNSYTFEWLFLGGPDHAPHPGLSGEVPA